MAKKNKKIPKIKSKNKPQIPNVNDRINNDEKRVYFSFVYPNWIKSFKHNDFTTYLKDETMFAKQMTFLFNELMPKVSEGWLKCSNTTEFYHCHKVNNTRVIGKYQKAIRVIHPQISVESLEIWQFGFKGNSMRLICHKVSNTNNLIPLLIDHHHLGYESQYYNQTDYSAFSFCPINNYN
ncbi:hypothetical protein [Streptococcus halichoeri]|uniref:hypothetical protein n=1 Tax=Streptococcus halichoeri TaxID=254785 RepID=UPI001C8E67C6|nr:hypothetical protein [Streptococcus halichoeri]